MEKIEKTINETIKKYNLLSKKDKIVVAVSGGKDSTVSLFALEKLGYDIQALSIDVGVGEYSKKNLENISHFCKGNGIKLHILSFRKEFGGSLCYLRQIFESKGIKITSCSLCGVLRRYLLNKYARKLGATKIVTGHNLDDEAQSIMMNFFRNTLQRSARLGPISPGSIKGLVPRIKPLYFCAEKDIEAYSKSHNFPVKYGKCPCSLEVFRRFTGNMLDDYEKTTSKVKLNIVKNFLKMRPKLRKRFSGQKFSYCKKCGEPSKEDICRTCQIIGIIRK
jgi:uncharacterized protein (TIGR00269 family)